MTVPTLTTERLILRAFTIQDIDALHAALDQHPDVWKFDPGRQYTLAERREIVEYRILENKRGSFGTLAVTLQGNDTAIGYCGLQCYRMSHPDALSTLEVELYYKLGREHWGKGYATEACTAMLQHAFTEMKLPRIVTYTHKDNAESIALLRRLGMQIEPDTLEADEVNGILDNPGG